MTTRWLGLLAMGLFACTADSKNLNGEKPASTKQGLTGDLTSQKLVWGDAPDTIGFRPGMQESMAMGAPAVAVGANGQAYILDALHERVVKATKGDLVQVAKVPRDCDDLAVSADGAIAVRRSVKQEVIVFTPTGELVGTVSTSAVEDVDAISLGMSRRVSITDPFQNTFLLGSPSAPQMAAAIQSNVKKGAALLPDGRGLVAVHTEAGDLELRVMTQSNEHTTVAARFPLGKGDAARIIGADRGVACARIEHTSQSSDHEITTKREVACVDTTSGKQVFRKELPPPGAYLPRRELAFAGGQLVFARPTADGLEISSWAVEASNGGVR